MYRFLVFVFAFSLALPCLAGSKPMPSEKALEASKRLIIDAFRKELSAQDKGPAIRAMIETADDTHGDDAGQAALYLSAAEVAARAGDTKLAFEALEQLGATFDVDLLKIKLAAMDSAAKSARTNDARISIANRCLEIVDDASRASRFDVAEAALKTAAATAAKVRDADLRKEIATRRRDIEKAGRAAQHAEQAVAAARKVLKENPNDAQANETIGKHLAFDRNDWVAGLKHLAKAGDDAIKNAAKADLAGSADQAKALGDQWWAIAECPINARELAGYRSRAVFWYTRAVGGLSGLQKTLVEKRIAEAGKDSLAAAADQTGGENDRFIDVTLAPGVLMRLIKVPASADGKIKEFYLGQTEVTQKQWQAVIGSNPSADKGEDLPVTMMTYEDCLAFCNKLSSGAFGKRYNFRMPSETELHFACFLGMPPDEAYPGDIGDYAWFKSSSANRLHQVAQRKPNRIGLYDLLGNVWEWTSSETDLFGGSFDLDDSVYRSQRIFTPEGRKLGRNPNFGLRIAAESR